MSTASKKMDVSSAIDGGPDEDGAKVEVIGWVCDVGDRSCEGGGGASAGDTEDYLTGILDRLNGGIGLGGGPIPVTARDFKGLRLGFDGRGTPGDGSYGHGTGPKCLHGDVSCSACGGGAEGRCGGQVACCPPAVRGLPTSPSDFSGALPRAGGVEALRICAYQDPRRSMLAIPSSVYTTRAVGSPLPPLLDAVRVSTLRRPSPPPARDCPRRGTLPSCGSSRQTGSAPMRSPRSWCRRQPVAL